MPQRRGLRGGAEQGLDTLSRILASLLQNRMVGERQQEFLSSQNEAISEREEARFDRQQALEEARSQVASRQAEAKRVQDLAMKRATGEITPEQFNALMSGQMEGIDPQQTFTGETGIGAQDAAGMNLSERQRALQASGVQEQPQINQILGREPGSGPAMPAPSHPGFAKVERQRQRRQDIEDRRAEFDPSIASLEAQRAGQIAGAERPSIERIEDEAAARARGTAAGTPEAAGSGKPTEKQGVAALVASGAARTVGDTFAVEQRAFGGGGFGMTDEIDPTSETVREYRRVQDNYFNMLRTLSGAAIPPEEQDLQERQYFAKRFDPPSVIQSKQFDRTQHLIDQIRFAGPAAEQIGVSEDAVILAAGEADAYHALTDDQIARYIALKRQDDVPPSLLRPDLRNQ